MLTFKQKRVLMSLSIHREQGMQQLGDFKEDKYLIWPDLSFQWFWLHWFRTCEPSCNQQSSYQCWLSEPCSFFTTVTHLMTLSWLYLPCLASPWALCLRTEPYLRALQPWGHRRPFHLNSRASVEFTKRASLSPSCTLYTDGTVQSKRSISRSQNHLLPCGTSYQPRPPDASQNSCVKTAEGTYTWMQ